MMTQNRYSEADVDFRVMNGFIGIDPNFIRKMNFCCICFNIRSIKKNWSTFLAEIQSILCFVDIICLVEINLKEEEENAYYEINGFNAEFYNRKETTGGGIAMFIKNGIRYERSILETTSYENLIIKIEDNEGTKFIHAIYRPPKRKISEFIEEMDRNIKHEKYTIVLGDMNINIKNSSNPQVLKYMEVMASKGLTNVILQSTRIDVSAGSSTIIDHIFVTISNQDIISALIETDISDHFATMYATTNHTKRVLDNEMNVRIDQRKANQIIQQTNWQELCYETDVERLYNLFVEKMNSIYVQARTVITIKNNRQNKPWISPEIIALCKTRDTLYKRWRNNPRNKSYELQYKQFRNVLNKNINNIKCEFYKNQFANAKNDPKKTWNILNEILGRKKKSIDEVIINNFPANKTSKAIAEDFSDHFSSQALKIVHSCNSRTLIHQDLHIAHSIYLEKASELEVLNMLTSLNTNKGPGADNVRAVDLKQNAVSLAPVIRAIINQSLDQCYVPKALKRALIRPIFKGGVKTKLENYRPIAILPVVEKCLEEIVVRRLNSFITKYKILQPNQYGFQKGKNTGKLLGEFTNVVNVGLNKNHHVLVMFVDFSKAFDTIDHIKLIEALNKIGVRGNIAKWLKSYLSERSTSVKIVNDVSEETRSDFGVPQGSKLGPILFILFTNELLRVFIRATAFAFADDIAIIVKHNCLATATTIMQEEFDKLTKWCHDNGLVVNADKTKLMHIRIPSQPEASIRIYLQNNDCPATTKREHIQVVKSIKYLGIVIDDHFIWQDHILKIRSQLKSAMFAMVYLKRYTSTDVQKQVYYALVESRLRYGVLAWGNASKTHTDKLISLQRRIIKTINTNRVNFKVLDVKGIFKMTAILEYYDDHRFQQPICHNRNTRRRQQGLLEIPGNINVYGKRQLSCAMPTILNKIPNNLKNIINFKKRKKKLKEFFLINNFVIC